MPYWQLFYHFVWSTKNREPLLTPEVEPLVHGFLRGKAIGLGATVFALNGIADHVHVVASVPPKLAVATFIGQVKGVASAKTNKAGLTPTPFSGKRNMVYFRSTKSGCLISYTMWKIKSSIMRSTQRFLC